MLFDRLNIASIDKLSEAMAEMTNAGKYQFLRDLSAISDAVLGFFGE